MPITLGHARLCQNRLLAKLSDEHYKPLLGQLDLVENTIKQTLQERNHPIEFVYFPCTSALSNLIYMHDGAAVEVGTVGNEGFTGVELLLNASVATEMTVCQVPGKSLRMTASNFKKAIIGPTPLRHLGECYFQGYLSQVSQSVACNRRHSMEQRFARWLLITHDRVQGEEFNLTQEFIADMLGVHRPSVSVVAGQFQKDGLIEYTRGHMKIVNRPALENISCECYSAVCAHFKRTLGIQYG